MGAKYSPSLANLVISLWEEIYIYSTDNPFLQDLHQYGRYIDDLLIIWQMSLLYQCPSNISMTILLNSVLPIFQMSFITFLDLKLIRKHEQYIVYSTVRKPTAGNTILHYRNHHSTHTRKSIPDGEMTQAKRNCSKEY